MNKNLINTVILTLTMNVASASNLDTESLKARLLSPSFPELQSEFVFGDITCYDRLDDETIKKGLNKHFERIQFMAFDDCSTEGK